MHDLPPQEILAYLLRHPNAEDTIEGIAEWWLLQQRVDTAVQQVGSALTRLAALGFVKTRVQADGRVVYRLDRSRAVDAQTWLDEDLPADDSAAAEAHPRPALGDGRPFN